MAVKKDDGGDKKSGKDDLKGKAAPDRPGGPQGDFSVSVADDEEEIKQFLHHQYNQKLDGKPPEKEPKYASIPEAKDGENAAEQSRKKFAKNAEKQTTAAVEPDTQLPQAVQQADPQANAQVLPQMFQQLSKVMSIMKAGGGGGGQQQQQQNQQNQQQGQQQGDQGQLETNAGIQENLTTALSRSLASLARKYSFKQTIDTFNTCLANNGISKLDRSFQPVVRNALGNLIQNAIDNGETNLTIYTPPEVVYGSNTPSPIVTYSQVPDYSVKQYYYSISDYNPGYIEWNDLNNNSYYIKRTETDYPFETLSDEITYGMQSGLETDLDPYIANQNLTTPKLNEILRKYNTQGAAQGKETSAGKNNNNNNNNGGGGGGQNLLGMLQQAINMVKQDQLPQSVLKQESVNKSLDKYQDNMSLIKRMKKESEKAADPTSSLQGLMGGGMPMNLQSMMSQVSGAMKSSGSSQGSQNSVQDLLKNITNKNDFTQK